jgi:MFS family permease
VARGGLKEKVRESGAALGRVFANAGLRRINLAFTGSVIGDWAFAVVVSVYAFDKGGPTTLGLLGVVRYTSMALLAPLLATLADRYPRRLVMIGADLLRAALVGAVAVIVASGGPSLAVYALTTITVVLGTAFRPAQAALLPALTDDPSDLTAANVASSTIESVGFFAGPALAALLLAVTSRSIVFAADALSFVWSAVLIAGLHVDDRPGRDADDQVREGFVAETTAGFRTIFGDRDLRLLMALFFAQTVVAGASLVFEVAVALRLLDLGQSGVGLLSAVVGVGGIVGGFAALVMATRKKLSGDFGLGVVLWSAPLLLLAASPHIATAVVTMALIGVGNSLVDINAFTILQRIVPDEVMGRVFGAVESTLVAGMALGALLMPLLMSSLGLRGGLAVIGGAVAATVAVSVGGLRRIDRNTLVPARLPLVVANEILAPLPEAVQERLARALVPWSVPTGGIVFSEGDAGDRYYIIEAGTVEVTSGGEIVNRLGPGDGFGEIALLRDVPRQATIHALEDLSLVALDRDVFISAVTGHGEAVGRADNIIARLLGV